MTLRSNIATELAGIVGAENISNYEEQVVRQLKSQIDKAIAPDRTRPACIIYPNTQQELAAAIALASARKWRILPCGRGSKLDWGGLAGDIDLVVSTAKLDRIIEHAVGDLTVTVEAGVKFADLQAILAKAGQFLAIDPAYPEESTIGGIVATASTGSLRQRYNSVRDMCLGISFVRSDGELVKAGGRVVKNVAGYDLMKLLTGSYGTLGIVSQLTFRLYPLAEASQTLVLTGDPDAIDRARNQILASSLTPTAIDLLSENVLAELDPSLSNRGMGLAVRFASIAQSVTEQCDRTLELAKQLNLQGNALPDAANFWDRLQDIFWRSGAESAICKVGVLPARAVAVMHDLGTITAGRVQYAQIHAASGLGLWRFDVTDSALPIEDMLMKARSLANASGGFFTILKAPVSLKQQVDVWGYSGNALDTMQRIKTQFDLDNLLSPSRFVAS